MHIRILAPLQWKTFARPRRNWWFIKAVKSRVFSANKNLRLKSASPFESHIQAPSKVVPHLLDVLTEYFLVQRKSRCLQGVIKPHFLAWEGEHWLRLTWMAIPRSKKEIRMNILSVKLIAQPEIFDLSSLREPRSGVLATDVNINVVLTLVEALTSELKDALLFCGEASNWEVSLQNSRPIQPH